MQIKMSQNCECKKIQCQQSRFAYANKTVKEPFRDVSGEQKTTSAGAFSLCLRSNLASLNSLFWFFSHQMVFRVVQQLQLSDISNRNHF